ncbi:DUF2723 domain-containing protein [Candidatus Poribacteria bacterium]|nr:DUF2723 domain-containing protein [Candidatus Poribacteria bacterium]
MNDKLKNNIINIVLFFVLFAYLKTIPASLSPGDPGELITAGYTLGIAHPSGYPFYTLICKLFVSIFPLGNIAFRANIMTMLFTISGLCLFYITLIKQFNNTLAAAASTLLLAFSPTLWGQSLIGEVYSLTFLFTCILLYLEINDTENVLIYYIYALSIVNHHIMLLFAPFYMIKIYKGNNIANLNVYLNFMLGISSCLYIFIRSKKIPLFNWGNPSTLGNFIRHITRAEYGSIFKNSFSIINSLDQIKSYIISLSAQFSPLLVLLGLLGIFTFSYKKRFAFIGAFLASGIGVILLLNIPLNPRQLFDVEVFYIPSYTIFSFFIGCGINYITNFDIPIQDTSVLIRNNISGILNKYKKELSVFLISFLALLIIYQFYCNFNVQNRSKHLFAYNYGINILNTLRKDGIIFASKDNVASALSYLILVENRRKDIIFYNPSLQIIRNIYPSSKEENEKYIKSKIDWMQIPIYHARNMDNFYQEGLLYTNDSPRTAISNNYNLYGVFDSTNIKCDFETRSIIADEIFSLLDYYQYKKNINKIVELAKFNSYLNQDNVAVLLKLGILLEWNKKHFDALDEYMLALKLEPQSADIHNNLGFIYHEIGNYQLAYQYHEKALKIDKNLANAYFGLAQAEEALGNFRKATALWKKYLELEKNKSAWTLEAERHIGHINKGIMK